MIYDLVEEDIEQVLGISDICLGKNFLTRDSILEYVKNPLKIIKVHRINNVTVGYVKGRIIEKPELLNTLFKINLQIKNELRDDGLAGVFETLCIKEEYQRKGIGKGLADELIKCFRLNNKIDKIYTTVWKSRYESNSKKLIERMGFLKVTEIKDFWYNDSMHNTYMCPKCGEPPCRCSMIFYSLK